MLLLVVEVEVEIEVEVVAVTLASILSRDGVYTLKFTDN